MQSSLAAVIACGLCLWLGWYLRDIRQLIQLVWDDLHTRMAKNDRTTAEQPRSMIVEPRDETPAERAKREQDELIESLNPPR